MKLKPGPSQKERVNVKNTRGMPFCGLGAWTFETQMLARNLSLDTARADGWAAILRDELHCTYRGCGYGADTSANYVP